MTEKDTKLRLPWLSISLLVLVVGCSASKPMIRSDYDHTADFAAYKTFGFFTQLATDKGYETLVTRHLKAAVTQQMFKRGFQFSHTNPDLLVNFNVKLEDKQQLRTTHYPTGYYGYRGGYYGVWGGYAYDTYTYQYTEGTLNIDVVDGQRKTMVWEGVAVGRVNQSDYENQEKVINRVVKSIFKEFPVKSLTDTVD